MTPGEMLSFDTNSYEMILAAERSRCGGTVILNVGGSVHQVRWDTIDKFPRSRLQRLRYATSERKLLYRWTALRGQKIKGIQTVNHRVFMRGKI